MQTSQIKKTIDHPFQKAPCSEADVKLHLIGGPPDLPFEDEEREYEV
jgi:hypothetical protein